MRVNKSGWIKLYRQILLNEWWQDKPFAKGQAWIDLLLLYDKNLDRLVISKRELSRRWGWSMSKVQRFLENCESYGDLQQKKEQKRTVIWLAKYKFFQEIAYQKGTKSKPIKLQTPDVFKKREEKKEVTKAAILEFWERQR